MFPDKKNISISFSGKALSYDKYGNVQNLIAERLAEMVSKQITSVGNLLDLGSGTGNLARYIQKKTETDKLILLDISFNSLMISKKRVTRPLCVNGDIDFIPLKNGTMDLVTVSSSLQWIRETQSVLDSVFRLLKPPGLFAFAVMLNGSMENFRETQKIFGIEPPVDFTDKDDFLANLEKSGLTAVTFETSEEREYFSCARDLLKSLSGLGSTSHRGSRLGRSEIAGFCRELEHKSNQPGKIELEYSLLYGIAEKR